MKKSFNGFQEESEQSTFIPDVFFRDLLPGLDDINEIKLVLYILWKVSTLGNFGIPITVKGILEDRIFMDGINTPPENEEVFISDLLDAVCGKNILLKSKEDPTGKPARFFVNSASGRVALKERPFNSKPTLTTLDAIQPNIFHLYEENIGPLTPMIADMLRDAENDFPSQWIKEAIQIAVQNNVRRWRYIESILDRWQKEGRDGTDSKNNKEDYRRYIKGEYGDIGHH